MIDIRKLSNDELVELTGEILDTNQFYVKQLTDKNTSLDKLNQDKKKIAEIIDRLEDLVIILYNDVEKKYGNPKTKSYKDYSKEVTTYPYIFNAKEGSIRCL